MSSHPVIYDHSTTQKKEASSQDFDGLVLLTMQNYAQKQTSIPTNPYKV